MNYVWRVGRSLSRVLNALTGGSDRDMLSQRIGFLMRVYPDHWLNNLPMPRWLRQHFLAS